MAESLTCDQCGKTVRTETAINWRHVSIPSIAMNAWAASPGPFDFCGFGCLSAWANARTIEAQLAT